MLGRRVTAGALASASLGLASIGVGYAVATRPGIPVSDLPAFTLLGTGLVLLLAAFGLVLRRIGPRAARAVTLGGSAYAGFVVALLFVAHRHDAADEWAAFGGLAFVLQVAMEALAAPLLTLGGIIVGFHDPSAPRWLVGGLVGGALLGWLVTSRRQASFLRRARRDD